MTPFETALAAGSTTTADALALFDGLDAVGLDFMPGTWRGTSFRTGHPLDGVLEAYRWQGKRFDTPEDVHPLVFRTLAGGTLCLRAGLAPLAIRLLEACPPLRTTAAGMAAQLVLPLLATRRAAARLRMTVYRGVPTATMIYDTAPINDVFRKVDADTVLGVMDMKGRAQPFFFVLRRSAAAGDGGPLSPGGFRRPGAAP
jgi:hypothetical protein